MPWSERDRMSLREELIHLIESQKISMTELCRRFQLSRKTGYKWVQRFRAEGTAGLADRSRRPQSGYTIRCRSPRDSILWRNGNGIRRGGARKLRQRAHTHGLPMVPAV